MLLKFSKKLEKKVVDETWKNIVLKQSLKIGKEFLKNDDRNIIIESA